MWPTLVPAELAGHCRLGSLVRGVLRVAVEDSAHLYDLDRLLRQGLQSRLRAAVKGPAIHRVQLLVAPAAPPTTRPTAGSGKVLADDPL